MQPAHVPAGNLPGLVQNIYEAAADASCWPKFLDSYFRTVKGRRAILVLSVGQDGGGTVFHSPGSIGNSEPRETDWSASNDWLRWIGSSQSEAAVWNVDLLRMEASAEWVNDARLSGGADIRYLLAGVFLRAPDATSMLLVLRCERDGPFGEAESSVLRSLMPHLRQAALLFEELSSLRARMASFTAYLDRSIFPFLLIDGRSRVLYGNLAAKQTAALKDGIAIAAGRLTVTSLRSRAAFANIIENVASGRAGPFCRIEVGRPSRKAPYRVLLMAVPSSEGLPRGLSRPAAIVLIIDAESKFELDADILGEVFCLTPAEARVTGKLGAGQSAEEIAADIGVSLQTVRTHIRRVLVKTATGRQGELIALILRTAPFCRI